jgi:serine/threonine protein kinase
MTQHKSKKRLVRERMARTGESYQAAERAVVAAKLMDLPPELPAPLPDHVPPIPGAWALRYDDQVFVMTEAPFAIGRNASCQLVLLEDAAVSRKHASFRVVGGRLDIEDHESRNGVLVNGKRISGHADLLHGDVVVIGSAMFAVVQDVAAPPTTVASNSSKANRAAIVAQSVTPQSVTLQSVTIEDVLDGRFHVGRLVQPGAGPLSGAPSSPFPWVELEAEHKLLGGEITIKLLPGNIARLQRTFRELLLHEGRALRRAAHPSVQKVFDVGETDGGGLYLVLERPPARTLDRAIEAGDLTPELTLHVTRELASLLAHLHAKGIVHRDLRNGVIHLGEAEGSLPSVKLASFALATIASEATPPAPRALMPRPDPVWTAPERHRGEESDARSDLYALGVVLFTMLTGRLPEGPEPPLEEATPLAPICRKLLSRDPSARYGSARELATDLPIA